MTLLASIIAYPLPAGGFGASMLDETTRQVFRREDCADLETATRAVQALAQRTFGSVTYQPLAKAGEYYANVWSV